MKNRFFQNIKRKKSGYAMVELLFYISVFTILVLVVINAMVVMSRSFRETVIYGELIGAGSMMERMSREIKQANSINAISATDLTLNTKDQAGLDKTVRFALSGANLNFLENAVSSGNLNGANISVSALSFTEITTAQGKAIKITMTFSSTNDIQVRSVTLYDTVVLRGSY